MLGVEPLHRLHQPDVRLGDHLGGGQAVAAVAHGDLGGEAQVAGDELVRRLLVAVVDPGLGQHVFLLRLQHREAADFLHVARQPLLGRRRRQPVVSQWHPFQRRPTAPHAPSLDYRAATVRCTSPLRYNRARPRASACMSAGDGRLEAHRRAADRVGEAEARRVQRLARERRRARPRPGGGRRRRPRPADARRRPCGRGFGACARSRAGTRPAPPPGLLRPEPLQHPRPGHRRLAGLAQHRHPLAVAGMPPDPLPRPGGRRPAPS